MHQHGDVVCLDLTQVHEFSAVKTASEAPPPTVEAPPLGDKLDHAALTRGRS